MSYMIYILSVGIPSLIDYFILTKLSKIISSYYLLLKMRSHLHTFCTTFYHHHIVSYHHKNSKHCVSQLLSRDLIAICFGIFKNINIFH